MWIVKISGVTDFDAALSIDVSEYFAIGVIIEDLSNVRQVSKFDARRIFASIENCVKIAELNPSSIDEIFDILDVCKPDMIQINGKFFDDENNLAELQSLCTLPIIASVVLDRKNLQSNIVDSDPITTAQKLEPFVTAINFNMPLGDYWKSVEKRKKIAELYYKIRGSVNKSVIVGGGLNAQNVGEIVETLQPAAIDVSSYVEKITGIKDPGLMQEFLDAVFDCRGYLKGI